MTQVGCENEDGTLNIHSEQETCAVCAPPSREAAIAARLDIRDKLRQESGVMHVAPNGNDLEADLRYLLAHLQQARQELQHWRTAADNFGHTDAHSWSLSTDEAEAALQQAREALKRYGQHESENCFRMSTGRVCECGLDAALKAVR